MRIAVADEVPRVELSAAGLSRLSGLAQYGRPMSAVLMDRAGSVCGRIRKISSPGSPIYSDGHEWHAQIGGSLLGSEWAGTPMGCGCGESPAEAVRAAREDLRLRAQDLLRQAARIAAMIGVPA